MENNMDLEYIRFLMLHSDKKFPFKKAKADPGLGESINEVKSYFNKHGNTRKIENDEANEIMMREKTAKGLVRDIDDMYVPKAEKQLNDIENSMKVQDNLENEIAMLKKMVAEKEAQLKARSNEVKNDDIKPRDLGETGYTDKVV